MPYLATLRAYLATPQACLVTRAPCTATPPSAARATLLDELPGQLAARVGALGKRHPPEQVRDLVVALCQARAWKAEELAVLLSRNPETLRQNYLRPLLAQHRLVMTLPDTPNSPQQAYRAADDSGR